MCTMCLWHAADSECASKHWGVSLAELFTGMLMQDESGLIVSENNRGLAGVRLHVWLHSRHWCRVAAAHKQSSCQPGTGQEKLTDCGEVEGRPKKGIGPPDWQPPSQQSSTSRGRGCRGRQEVKWRTQMKKDVREAALTSTIQMHRNPWQTREYK